MQVENKVTMIKVAVASCVHSALSKLFRNMTYKIKIKARNIPKFTKALSCLSFVITVSPGKTTLRRTTGCVLGAFFVDFAGVNHSYTALGFILEAVKTTASLAAFDTTS